MIWTGELDGHLKDLLCRIVGDHLITLSDRDECEEFFYPNKDESGAHSHGKFPGYREDRDRECFCNSWQDYPKC